MTKIIFDKKLIPLVIALCVSLFFVNSVSAYNACDYKFNDKSADDWCTGNDCKNGKIYHFCLGDYSFHFGCKKHWLACNCDRGNQGYEYCPHGCSNGYCNPSGNPTPPDPDPPVDDPPYNPPPTNPDPDPTPNPDPPDDPIDPTPVQGYLIVRVTDCSTHSSIANVRVDAQAVVDPTKYTGSNGYTDYFYLSPGTYSVSVSKSGYQTKPPVTTTISSGQTTTVNICLDSIRKPCSISATVTTPNDAYVGQTVTATVKLTNSGDVGGWVDVKAYLCREDPTCWRMNCDGDDPHVSGRSTYTLTCSRTAPQEGRYYIKVDYSGCDADPTIRSGTFRVRSPEIGDCQISLVDKSIPSSIEVGDNLNIRIKLKMTFQDMDPYAKTTVYVERADVDPSKTRTFNFPYSGARDEETFRFYTDGWQTGTYRVYVKSVGEDNCDTLSKKYIGSVSIQPDYYDYDEDCRLRITDIILERDGVDPDTFYLGDNIRVMADISVTGADPLVTLKMYVDGSYYDSETENIPLGWSKRVTFDRLIHTTDYGVTDPTVKIVATAPSCVSGERTKFFSIISDVSAPTTCTPKYLLNYQCSGNWRQQLYRYSNCNTNWLNMEYCSDGCSNGHCLSAPTIPDPPPVAVAGNDQTVYEGTAVTLSASGSYDTDGYITSYEWREGSEVLSRSVSFTHVFSIGTHTITLTVTDNDGNTHSDTVIVTVNPYTKSEPTEPATCTPKYLLNYQCSGNWRQQLYRYSNCNTNWLNMEYCSDGCSNGHCLSAPTIPDPQPQVCTPGEIKNRVCSSSNQYQYQQCNSEGTDWVTLSNYCSSGTTCQNGLCIQESTCVAQYLDDYQCSNNWKQRLYRNSDCSSTWQNYEYCEYGCSSGQCVSQVSSSISKSAATQNGMDMNKVVYTTISLAESDDQVESVPACTAGYLNSYGCLSKYRQRQYQNSDCSIKWYNVEYCPYGCSDGQCLQPSTVTLDGKEEKSIAADKITDSKTLTLEVVDEEPTGFVVLVSNMFLFIIVIIVIILLLFLLRKSPIYTA